MPKQVKDVKEFMNLAKGDKTNKDKAVKNTISVKSGKKITKFKLRMSKYLYTFKTDKQNVAKKLIDSLGASVDKKEIKGRRTAGKKAVKK